MGVLVERNIKDAIVFIEYVLGPIAVMGVKIYYGNLFYSVLTGSMPGSNSSIIKYAEAAAS